VSEPRHLRDRGRVLPYRAAALAALTLLLAASHGEGELFDPRTLSSATLANGLVVVGCADESASVVSVEVVVRVGSADEPAALGGIAHLLEHLSWVGNPGDDPRQAPEQVGGVTNAGTLRDYTRFCATVPCTVGVAGPEEALGLALASLGRMASREQFDQEVLDRERRVILGEVAGRREHPRVVLSDLGFEALFGQAHPYGRRIEGEGNSLLSIGTPQLRSFRQAWYVPNNMAVIVCSPLPFRAVLPAVERVFGSLSPQALPPRAVSPMPRPAKGAEKTAATRASDAYMMAAFVGPSAAERTEVCASDVLAMLLGNAASSRLRSRVVERSQLAEEVGVEFLTQRDRALFGVWAMCDAANIAAVKEAVREELARLAEEGTARDELRAAKRLVYADYAFANETPADRCAALAFYEAIDSYRAAAQYLSRVVAVTPDDLKTVAAWYAADPVWVVLTPEDRAP